LLPTGRRQAAGELATAVREVLTRAHRKAFALPNLATPDPIRGLLPYPRVAITSDSGFDTVLSSGTSPPTMTRGRSGSEPSSSAARRAFARRRQALAADGRWGERFVDPAPARRHLVDVMGRYEISLATAAALCRVGASTLCSLTYPEHAAYDGRLHVDTAAAVLDLRVDLDRVPAAALLSAAGTRRRLEGLAAVGWPLALLDDLLGLPINTLSQWRRRRRVTAAHARRVRAVFDDLSMQPGPSRVARRRARSAGWLPPLAWDDEDLDNPQAHPWLEGGTGSEPGRGGGETILDEVAVELAMAGDHPRMTSAEALAAALRLAAAGVSDGQIGDRVGVSSRTVARWRGRAGCPSVWELPA